MAMTMNGRKWLFHLSRALYSSPSSLSLYMSPICHLHMANVSVSGRPHSRLRILPKINPYLTPVKDHVSMILVHCNVSL